MAEILAHLDTLDRVKRLIVNADDFGLTAGVNAAVIELHQRGPLTSTTLMANAVATSDAIHFARATPTLGVGCHVVLVDGQSLLTPRRDLLWLVDPVRPAGKFKSTLGSFLQQLYLGRNSIWPLSNRKLEDEIEAETHAQIALLQNSGLRLTHIDTHKHTHMFPRVLRSVLRGARAAGVTTIRNPFEPSWSTDATPGAPLVRRMQVRVLRQMRRKFCRIVREEGFATTDGAVGVLATGTLDPQTIRCLLDAMPDGTWELVTHPGYNDPALAKAGTRLLASREVERQALLAAAIPAGIELLHFGRLTSGT